MIIIQTHIETHIDHMKRFSKLQPYLLFFDWIIECHTMKAYIFHFVTGRNMQIEIDLKVTLMSWDHTVWEQFII